MKWKHFLQTIIAAAVMLGCIWLGSAVWPSLKAMAPAIALTILIAVEIIVVSIAIGVPFAIFVFLRNHHKVGEAKMIEARKMPANERGYIGAYIAPGGQLISAQVVAHSPEVPNTVHIEEDHAQAANDLQERKFAWQQHLDMLKIAPPQAEQKKETPSVPDAPPFREVMPYIRQKERIVNGKVEDASEVVLACGSDGIVIGTVLDWLSTLVAGMPGNGKSTFLYFCIAQLMILRSKFRVLDPTGSLITLKPFLPYVNRHAACIAMAPEIEEELEARADRYEDNGGVCLDDHFMVIVDEIVGISDKEDQMLARMSKEEKRNFRSLVDVIRRVVTEGRKYKMYCMVVGQSIPATVLPTVARDNMSSKYVFYCSDSHARMAGLDGKSIENLLPLIDGAIGKCIVSPARMKPFIGAIPYTDVTDLRRVIDSTGYTCDDWPVSGVNSMVNSVNEPVTPRDGMPAISRSLLTGRKGSEHETGVLKNVNALPDGVTISMLQNIEQAYKAGFPLRDIAKLVRLDGRYYSKFKAACAYLGIGLVAEQEA